MEEAGEASAKALRQALPGMFEGQQGGQGGCSKGSKRERVEDEFGAVGGDWAVQGL